MRKGVYWLNLMTRDEQIGWHCWCGTRVEQYWDHYMELQSYRNFEEFINNTVTFSSWSQQEWFNIDWCGIIDKYSGHDILSPMKYLQPLNFSMTK